MRKALSSSLALLTVLAILLAALPAALSAQPPMPEDKPIQLAKPLSFKPKDAPNPLDYRRLRQREQLLMQGRTAEAAALAKTGQDNVLVLLVEFAGTDTATWNPGDVWDPIGDPAEVDYEDYGDCSGVITETMEFTYSGPLHNQLPKPTSKDHLAYNFVWREDFSRSHYQELLFGDGILVEYALDDGEQVTFDLRGYSMKTYFEEQSKGMYTVDGEVLGWVQVPHSEAWYGADSCPGARSADYSPISDGAFPNGGDERSLVTDAFDAAIIAYPDFDWARFDQDGDGLLDRLMLVHAGYGEETFTPLLVESGIGEHAIWSHSWTVWPYHELGDTGLMVGPYTMMPEDGSLDVFAHEFAHNLGTVDLYAYGPGDTSPGSWSLMADPAGGFPYGSIPPGLDPWHKYLLGWNDPLVLNTMSPPSEITVGQACEPPEGTEDSVLVNLPPQINQPVPPANGEYMWYSGKENWLDAQLTLAAPLDLSEAVSPTLTFDTFYDIEEAWDFGFVQVSTDGENWLSLPGTTTTDEYDPDCFFFEEMPGYTGFSGDWLEEAVDLSEYAGESTVWIRFRYETDPYTLYDGWYLDDITITSGEDVLFVDDAEMMDSKWVVEGWTRTDGYIAYPHYYLVEWRNACGFDEGLVSGFRGVKDFGMLVWYRNFRYSGNEPFDNLADGPAFGPKGAFLLVDAHPEPWRVPSSEYVNEAANESGRMQMRDAAFGLRETLPFRYSPLAHMDGEDYGSTPAVPAFHDSLGYYPGLEYVQRGPSDERIQWFTKDWDASVVIPARGDYGIAPPEYPEGEALRFGGETYPDGRSAWWWYPAGVGYGGSTGNPGEQCYGVHIKVLEEAQDLSWGKLRLWNNTDTVLSELAVDKDQAVPGDVLTYTLHLKNAASALALATLDIPIPEGTTFVPGSLTGANFVLDAAHDELHDNGRVLWGGRAGGKVLRTPDAHVAYQVQIDEDAIGSIENEALLTVEGHGSYSLTALTMLPFVEVSLAAPSYAGTRAPIRYTISVTNAGAGTLEDVNVAATWTGSAYIVDPNPDSWVIESLAPGATWTADLTLWTFSTASGDVEATVEVSHPWIGTATASATTTIVR